MDQGVEVGEARSSAEGASRVEAPMGVEVEGPGEEADNFLRFWGQNGVFSWTLDAKFRFFSITKTIQNYTRNTRTAMEIDLHAKKSVTQSRVSIPLSS